MNKIRHQFADRLREMASERYNDRTSPRDKLKDKYQLERDIEAARIPLVKIYKLGMDDLHRATQQSINSPLTLDLASKKVKYQRKQALEKVRVKILNAYRKDNSLDVLKYAQANPLSV